MKIAHIAIWVDDIELMRRFYTTYFDAVCGEKYHNPTKNFTSYIVSFNDGGAGIELMNRPDVSAGKAICERGLNKGLTHFSICVGNREYVDQLTERMRTDGYTVVGEARLTGDGFYESVVLDPEGNHIELSAQE